MSFTLNNGGPPAGQVPRNAWVGPLNAGHLDASAPMLGSSTAIGPNATGSYAGPSGAAAHRNAVPPLDVDITMVELCTYFPNHFQHPDVAERAVVNNWDRKILAKVQLHARGVLTSVEMHRSEGRMQKQFSIGTQELENIEVGTSWNKTETARRIGPTKKHTANHWESRASYQGGAASWGHIRMDSIGQNVTNHPQGLDAGPVTRCINFALLNPQLPLTTHHWHVVMRHLGITNTTLSADHDTQALARAMANIADP